MNLMVQMAVFDAAIIAGLFLVELFPKPSSLRALQLLRSLGLDERSDIKITEDTGSV